MKKTNFNELTEVDSKDRELFINRELSWMEFNKRVLCQALRDEVPLMERVKFLAISSSNLDEFISVRYAEVVSKVMNRKHKPDISGMTPIEEYTSVNKSIISFKKGQEGLFNVLKERLEAHNIVFCNNISELNNKERKIVKTHFEREVFPLLTPMSYDTTKDFPYLQSKKLNICVTLQDNNSSELNVIAIIPLDNVRRYYTLHTDDKIKIIPVEEIIYSNLNSIFYGKKILGKGLVRILREEDLEVSNNQDIYLVDRMRDTLLDRKHSTPLFMDLSKSFPKDHAKFIQRIFNISNENVFRGDVMEFSSLNDISIDDKPDYYYPKFTPQYPIEMIGEHDIFAAIDSQDILLMHPYESYGAVVKFVEHAAEDKDVLQIRMTLYRVSSEDSPIVESLCRAAEKGKQVSVLLEIKARFDEKRNIDLQEKLKASGCRVTFGLEHTKVHGKMCVVVKRTNKGLRIYSHVATGNYNDKTANLYTDFSYFTRKEKIGMDLINIFNSLTGFSEPLHTLNHVSMAPYNLRETIESLIDKEVDNARKGKPSGVFFIMNSLSDKKLIKQLYKASEDGVQITIICRGVCSMKPINKNIRIKSIVGRFLEHSRVYMFVNNTNPEVFISSADLLKRNLNKRVELLVPIRDTNCKNKLLSILNKYNSDSVNSYIMNKDGIYSRWESKAQVNIHQLLIDEARRNYKLRNIPKVTLGKR